MTVPEHLQTAEDFLVASEREFAAGDDLQGSEKLWGAASHAITAIALTRGWPCGSHRALRAAIGRLADEAHDGNLRLGFATAEKFHANFYHGFMEEGELAFSRPLVEEFVHEVLALAPQPPAPAVQG